MVVRDDLSVTLPEEVVEDMGLRAGSEVELKRQPGGDYSFRAVECPSKVERVNRLGDILAPYLDGKGGGVEAFLEWRRQDARLDGSL